MLTHQATYIDHLLAVVASERVDLVVVAGDVYDRALPHVDAVRLADEALARLAASRALVVLTSGNHDSAQRLGFSSRLIDAAGVFIRADASAVGTPVLLGDEHGPVAVHGIPYLDPDAVREPWGLAGRSHEAALTEAMRRINADTARRVAPGLRTVVLAHAFVAGGPGPVRPSDSERDISVGGVSLVPAAVFAGVDYTALGHLHGRHVLSDTVRYSGSPLAYSFSEADHRKGSWLVDLGPRGATATEFVDAPVPRPLARLRGTLAELLADPAHGAHEQAWVQATLTDDSRPLEAMDRLRERFPHALVLGFDPASGSRSGVPLARVQGRTDHDIALDFLAEMRGTPASDAESSLLREAFDACCEDTDVDVLLTDAEATATGAGAR
jgi:exonuclease SbcD